MKCDLKLNQLYELPKKTLWASSASYCSVSCWEKMNLCLASGSNFSRL